MQNHVPVIYLIFSREHKVSVFQQNQINYHPRRSHRSNLAQTLIKRQTTSKQRLDGLFIPKKNQKQKTQRKQRLDKLFITKQEKKARNKNKIGLSPNKRFSLKPYS